MSRPQYLISAITTEDGQKWLNQAELAHDIRLFADEEYLAEAIEPLLLDRDKTVALAVWKDCVDLLADFIRDIHKGEV